MRERQRPAFEKSDIVFSEPTGKLQNANNVSPQGVRVEGKVIRRLTSESLSNLILRKAMQLVENTQIPKELLTPENERSAQARNRKQTMPLGAPIPAHEPDGASYILVRKTTGEVVDIKSSFTVGSGMEVDYTVTENNFMSRLHAKLEIIGSVLLLNDAESLNGTFLNGEKINSFTVRVKPGDVVKFADEEFIVQRHE